MSKPKIVTVLRSGGVYEPKHVRWLKRQCEQYAPGYDFECLSDVPINGVTFKIMHRNWPEWWSKIELFEHYDNVLYLDLDTVLLDRIDLVLLHQPVVTDIWGLSRWGVNKDGFASGVMRWGKDLSHIADAFALDPEHWMQFCTDSKYWGDQGFIWSQIGDKFARIQEMFPNYVQSYKRDLEHGKYAPHEDTAILCFHGLPRPWSVQQDYIPRMFE